MTLLMGLVTVGGCESPVADNVMCARPGFYGLMVTVRDQLGRPSALGATLIVRERAYADTALGENDSLRVGAADNRAGIYSLEVTRPWYRSVEQQGVHVPGDRCGAIETVVVPATLLLETGAPPVRIVVVMPPRAGLGLAGLKLPYSSYVDADPGVDTRVTWEMSDTTVADISSTGVVVSKCRTQYGQAAVIATSVADTTKKGIAYVGVYANAQSCA